MGRRQTFLENHMHTSLHRFNRGCLGAPPAPAPNLGVGDADPCSPGACANWDQSPGAPRAPEEGGGRRGTRARLGSGWGKDFPGEAAFGQRWRGQWEWTQAPLSLETAHPSPLLGVWTVPSPGHLGPMPRRDLHLGFNAWCSRLDVPYCGSFEPVAGVRSVGPRAGVPWGLGSQGQVLATWPPLHHPMMVTGGVGE